jgi:uncharacterized membrane protein
MKIPKIIIRSWYFIMLLGFLVFFTPAIINLYDNYCKYGWEFTRSPIYMILFYIVWAIVAGVLVGAGFYLKFRDKNG